MTQAAPPISRRGSCLPPPPPTSGKAFWSPTALAPVAWLARPSSQNQSLTATPCCSPGLDRKQAYPPSTPAFHISGTTSPSSACWEKNPFVLAVNSKSDLKSLDDVAAALKAGKKLTYSTGGVGTLPHIGMVVLLDLLGYPADAMTHVPYKGGGAAAAALSGGHVDMFFQNLSGLIGQIQAGGLNALFITTSERFPALKDVPTAAEVGHPKLEVVIGWSALYRTQGDAPGRGRQVGGHVTENRRRQVVEQDDQEARFHSRHLAASGNREVRSEPVRDLQGSGREGRDDQEVEPSRHCFDGWSLAPPIRVVDFVLPIFKWRVAVTFVRRPVSGAAQNILPS